MSPQALRDDREDYAYMTKIATAGLVATTACLTFFTALFAFFTRVIEAIEEDVDFYSWGDE